MDHANRLNGGRQSSYHESDRTMIDEYEETPPKPITDSIRNYVASHVREWERLKQRCDDFEKQIEPEGRERRLHRTHRQIMTTLENDVQAVFDEHDLHELPLPDGRVVTFEPNSDATGHISKYSMRIIPAN